MAPNSRVFRARLLLLAWLLPAVGVPLEVSAQIRGGGSVRAALPTAPPPAFLPAGSVYRGAVFPVSRSYAPADVGALRRVVDRAGLNLPELSAMEPAARAEYLEPVIGRYAQGLAGETEAKTASVDDPVRSAPALAELKRRIQDAADAVKFLDLRDAKEISSSLSRSLSAIDSALTACGDSLAERAFSSLSGPGVVWHGRTAVVPVGEDGSAVALKFARPGKDVDEEGFGMERAARSMLGVPTVLPGGDPRHVRPVPAGGPEAKYGTAYMAYLLPGDLARDFFRYLGDPLPADWSRERKMEAVRSSALKAVEGMRLLLENGWVHETLAPLSHSEASWKWDYWRPAGGTTPFEVPRFGPTSVHNWDEGLSYANVRLSGLADFEHLKPAPSDPSGMRQAAGQNIFELSMLVIRAGYRNGLGAGATAGILVDVLRRHADGFSTAPVATDEMLLRPFLTGVVRRLHGFYVVAQVLPRFIVRWINGAISKVSQMAVPEEAALVMLGEVVHPLIMDVIKPYVEALFGGSHPSSSVPYPDRPSGLATSRLRRAVLSAIKPMLLPLFGLETAPYFKGIGRFSPSWIWREGQDRDVSARRKRAAILAGRRNTGVSEAMESFLRDPDEDVRRFAAAALKTWEGPGLLNLLETASASSDGYVRNIAITRLAGQRDQGALALIERLAARQDSQDRHATLLVLAEARTPVSRGFIETLLADEDASVRQLAARLLQTKGRDERGLLPLLETALLDHDPGVRRKATFSLFGRQDSASLALIARALSDEDFGVRRYAAGALRGRDDSGVLALVEKALSDPHEGVRLGGMEALAGRKDLESLAMIEKILDDRNPDFRRLAAGALVGRHDAASLPLVEKAFADPGTRDIAQVALSRRTDAGALRLLEKFLMDESPRVRMNSLDVLSYRSDPGAVALVKRALGDQDPDVRRAAVQTLSGRDDGLSLALIEQSLADPDERVLSAAIHLLFSRDDPAGFAAFGKAVSHPDARVRGLAAGRLESWQQRIREQSFLTRAKIALARLGHSYIIPQ